MTTMENLAEIIAMHTRWLDRQPDGQRADLRDADLIGSDLRDADLRDADLRDADLHGADLRGADLHGANLIGSDLRGADLSRANLSHANLRGAELGDAQLSAFSNCPDTGSFTGWKKLNGQCVAKLLIPENARRTSSIASRRCRAEFALVISVFDINGIEIPSGVSAYDNALVYTVGEMVKPDAYNDDIRVEGTNGIHFFITRKEAEDC